MNRWKRRRKPRIAGMPIRASKVKYQRNRRGWCGLTQHSRMLFAASFTELAKARKERAYAKALHFPFAYGATDPRTFAQLYGARRQGKSIVAKAFMQQMMNAQTDYGDIEARIMAHVVASGGTVTGRFGDEITVVDMPDAVDFTLTEDMFVDRKPDDVS